MAQKRLEGKLYLTREIPRTVKVWRVVIGVILVVAGIAGLVLPVLPGWLLFFIGLSLLGLGSSPLAHKVKQKFGLGEVHGHEDIDRVPAIYRTGIFVAILILQVALLVVSFVLRENLVELMEGYSLPGIELLNFSIPTLAFFLGLVGLAVATVWKPEDLDEEKDVWETYFVMELVTLPLFWSLLQYLVSS